MKVGSLGDLYSKFGKRVPWHVDWEITYYCQNRCRHCYLMHTKPDIRKQLEISRVHQTLDELQKLGTAEIGFTGGDPFLYNGFMDVLAHAKDNGFNSIILTSGLGINDKMIDFLPQANVVKMEFTFLGGDAETHDAFTRNPGSYDKLFNILKVLHKRGINCIAKMIITDDNKHQVKLLKKQLEQLGIRFTFDPHIWRPYDGIEDDVQKFRISQDDMKEFYRWQSGNYVEANNDIHMCVAGRNKVGITPEGLVNPCGMYGTKFVFGSLQENSFTEIWNNSEELLQFLNKTSQEYPIKKCITCENRIYCDWCPGLSAWCNENIYEPYEELCKDTELKRLVADKVDCN